MIKKLLGEINLKELEEITVNNEVINCFLCYKNISFFSKYFYET